MKRTIYLLTALAMAIGLPLLGAVWTGTPIGRYLEFPPMTQYVRHASFSWPLFIALAALILAVIVPFEIRVFRARKQDHEAVSMPQLPARFPYWGWMGLVAGVCAWVLAWSRFDWFAAQQPFTFSPLWFSYIVVVNAWTWKRAGRCMMLDCPKRFAGLFVLSAGFWWYFEYLNRFVQNWHYTGVQPLSPLEYTLFATLPFSTVLPAVLGTYELIKTNPRIGAGLDDFHKIRLRTRRGVPAAALAAAGAGLVGIGIWPDFLFPLLWISPLLIVTCLRALAGENSVFAPLAQGRWRNLYLLALASLICGGFWEMWNFFSLAKWVYTVPFVGEFKLFEMPLLGYAGYLPFGIECAVVAQFVGFEIERERV